MSKVVQIIEGKNGLLSALREDGTIWQRGWDHSDPTAMEQQFKWTEVPGPGGQMAAQQMREPEFEKNRLEEDRLVWGEIPERHRSGNLADWSDE